jgi:sensor histidine kinase YesM
MNPHFLFNSLSSIQNFVINEKPDIASDYISRFSMLVRQILNSSVEDFISLEDEISSLDNYLALQQIRHGEMFEYSIDIDKSLDTETIAIPTMLFQPFVENAIEHGLKHKESKGHIQIRINEEGGRLIIEIEDDGVGRERAKELEQNSKKDHKSLATSIVRERLDILNKRRREKIRFEIIDLMDGVGKARGTRVVFELPVTL